MFDDTLKKYGIKDEQYLTVLYLQARIDQNSEAGRLGNNASAKAELEGNHNLAMELKKHVKALVLENRELNHQKAEKIYPTDLSAQQKAEITWTANDLNYMAKDLDAQGKADFFNAAATWGISREALSLAMQNAGGAETAVDKQTILQTQQDAMDRSREEFSKNTTIILTNGKDKLDEGELREHVEHESSKAKYADRLNSGDPAQLDSAAREIANAALARYYLDNGGLSVVTPVRVDSKQRAA